MNIPDVFPVIRFPSIQVIMGMIADAMSLHEYPAVDVRIFPYVLPYAKESRAGVMLFQLIEYERGRNRMGPVIERQIEYPFRCGNIPNEMGIPFLQPPGRVNEIEHKPAK
jgi:hypothetical protein